MAEDIKHEIQKGLDKGLSAEVISEILEVSVDDVNEVSKDYTPEETKNFAEMMDENQEVGA